MMKVQQLMRRPVYWCAPDDVLDVPARLMWEGDCGSVPVCMLDDDGAPRVVGMITDRDIAMAAYTQGRALGQIRVRVAMSRTVLACRPTDSLGVVLRFMESTRLHRLPVVEAEDRLVGMVSLSDIAQAAADAGSWSNGGGIGLAAVGAAVRSISVRHGRELIVVR